jgi:signal transduction histidine kinase/AmiR/NasT family two-component response regulator
MPGGRKKERQAPFGDRNPFGVELSMAVFDRATRIAKSMFASADANATIVLVHEGQAWRSRYAEGRFPPQDPIAELVMGTGAFLWIEDARLDPRFADHPMVVGAPFVRLCVAVPICLADGSTPGALCVFGVKPHKFDETKAARLSDLADFVADEWARAQAAHAQRDRTERSEERLNMALELADLHVWEMDYVHRQLFKAGAEDTFFVEPLTYEDLFRDIYVTVDPRDRPSLEEAWRGHLENGTPYRPEYRIARSDGKEVWAESSVKLITGEHGRPQRMVGVLQDITHRKQVERELVQAKDDAEAANRAKSTFLATMSHEIRTPLNGVLGMAQAMAVDDLSETQRERLDVIRQSGETLLAILNDVLDLSKIEAGKLELEEGRFDISELAEGALAAFMALAEDKGVAFDLRVEAKAAGFYRGDSTRLRQILYNLISNALKFTEAGEVRVTVGRPKDDLIVEVRDSGIGISPDQLKSLFQKFEQADVTTTRRFGGTGLGLAICRELAQLMGGDIEARSSPGEGATFTVRLPLEKLEATPVNMLEATAAAKPVPREGAHPLRLLAAEDNAVNQLVLKTLLQQGGLDLAVVSDGVAAVAAWEAGDWDLILMDVQMPDMDGPTATRRIRAREAETGRARTPIVALTANAMAHQVAEYIDAGMDGFVSKPIEVARLFAAIDAALAPHEAEAAAAVA